MQNPGMDHLIAYESMLSVEGNMLFFVHKWKLYLYLNGVCIKKLKINVNESPKDNVYIFNVWFKKQFFRSNKVKIIVRPTKLIYTDEKKKETHWEFKYEEGIDI